MANKTIDALVFCPYYVCEGNNTITCEGIVGTYTISRFDTPEAKKEHEYNFCVDRHCQGCGVYSALATNYAASYTESSPNKIEVSKQ